MGLGLLAWLGAASAVKAQSDAVLQPLGQPLTRSITCRFNYQSVGASVSISPDRKYWWAGLDNTRELYGQYLLGDLFLQRVDYDPIGFPHPEFETVFTGSMHVVKMQHLGRGRGVALLLAHKGTLRLGTLSVPARDPQGINYAVAWMNEQGRCTRLQALATDNASSLSADTAGRAYVSFSRYPNAYILQFGPTGDSLMRIENSQMMLISNVAVTPAGDIVAVGSCMEAGATVGGLAVTDSIFTYTSFIAGYSPQGQGRWVHTVRHGTCPQERLIALPEGVVWMGSRIERMRIAGQTLPHPGTFFDGFFSATFNPVTGVLQSLVSGPDTGRAASIEAANPGLSSSARAGADFNLKGSPRFYGYRLGDSTTPYTQGTHMALHAGSLMQGRITSAEAAPLFVTGRSVYGLASDLVQPAQQYGALMGIVPGADTLRVYNGYQSDTYPVASSPDHYTLYLIPYARAVVTGVAPRVSAELMLTPNPASDHLRWTEAVKEATEIRLRNSVGQIAHRARLLAGEQGMDLPAGLPPGLYTLEWQDSKAVRKGRFLKI
ncbi:hypothetical protein WDZ92_03170 [Nostoc sp. NIES-2111]